MSRKFLQSSILEVKYIYTCQFLGTENTNQRINWLKLHQLKLQWLKGKKAVAYLLKGIFRVLDFCLQR